MAEYTSDLSQLLRAFAASGFSTLEVSDTNSRVRLRRAAAATAQRQAVPPSEAASLPAASSAESRPPAASPGSAADAQAAPPPSPVHPGWSLTSPRVGRFFQLQDAQGQPVMKPGTRIAAGQVYGIIESMQLRYEIRADREGIVDRMLVPSGEPVEFGQALVLLQS
ncbi:MAG: hypothetical protein HY303_01540 [Candidatus Wallbacteria bacterium]|nr:hypothetical protein [Candidatus Wallbacteria bacterium]